MAKRILKTATKAVNGAIGERFGRLVLLGVSGPRVGWWLMRCDCGVEQTFRRCHILSGARRSCGCLAREYWAEFGRKGTHHAYRSPEYISWSGLKGRCANPKSKKYPDYGGRGITVCPEWISSFETFLRDMGRKPSPDCTIERRNVNGPYAPWNCCWLPRSKQTVNRRNTQWITWGGVQRPLSHWCRELGLSRACIQKRARQFAISMQSAFELYMSQKGRTA